MEWGLLVASIALVVATGGLVYVTRGLVVEARKTRAETEAARREMEETRLLSVRPYLALEVSVIAPGYGLLAVRNVGLGSALDVELSIEFEPVGDVREWAWPTMPPGVAHEFMLPNDVSGLDAALDRDLVGRVSGSYSDVYGARFSVERSLDFAPWWEKARGASRRFEEPPLVKIARSLEKLVEATKRARG